MVLQSQEAGSTSSLQQFNVFGCGLYRRSGNNLALSRLSL